MYCLKRVAAYIQQLTVQESLVLCYGCAVGHLIGTTLRSTQHKFTIFEALNCVRCKVCLLIPLF